MPVFTPPSQSNQQKTEGEKRKGDFVDEAIEIEAEQKKRREEQHDADRLASYHIGRKGVSFTAVKEESDEHNSRGHALNSRGNDELRREKQRRVLAVTVVARLRKTSYQLRQKAEKSKGYGEGRDAQ